MPAKTTTQTRAISATTATRDSGPVGTYRVRRFVSLQHARADPWVGGHYATRPTRTPKKHAFDPVHRLGRPCVKKTTPYENFFESGSFGVVKYVLEEL